MEESSFFIQLLLLLEKIQSFLSNQTKTNTSIRSTFQQIEKCQYVKEFCICCSCRLNGTKIAKIECKKYNETSLHVFFDQIDYVKAQASTPYGILSVKLWVSYF
ncbi:unnamed protein product [Sphagnum troendelagicum]